MVLTLPIIIQILSFAGSIIAVYINLNNKIIKLEAEVNTNKNNISKIDAKSDKIAEDLKDIKELITDIKIELAVQKEKTRNE